MLRCLHFRAHLLKHFPPRFSSGLLSKGKQTRSRKYDIVQYDDYDEGGNGRDDVAMTMTMTTVMTMMTIMTMITMMMMMMPTTTTMMRRRRKIRVMEECAANMLQ
jgi:hypothetical protein